MMFRLKTQKGIILLIVLGMVLVVAILAQVILSLILSHSRFTHHQTSRIQAYYAAQAGMNRAIENLRTPGGWRYTSPFDNDCPNTNPATCIVSDTDFPNSIQSVGVVFCPAGTRCCPGGAPLCPNFPQCNPPAGSGINFCIQTTTNYTYTPS